MKMTVIIPSYNRETNLKKNLTCLMRQTIFETPHEVDIIVVDDDSTDSTQRVVEEFPVYYLKHTPRTDWNASKPRNYGAQASDVTSDLLYFLDSDVMLPPDRLQRIIDVYSANPIISRVIIGPYHCSRYNLDTTDPTWYMDKIVDYAGDIRWELFNKTEHTALNSGLNFALACFGGSLAIPRKLFFKAGGFDEEMLSGVEDGDFGLTLWETGAFVSMDKGLLGWHNPHEIVAGRTAHIQTCIEKLNKKHNMDIVKETGKVYRTWGLNWEPPESWVSKSGYTKEELKTI